MAWLELHAAELWDQVWWLSLPWHRRAWYWLRGYRAPLPVAMWREWSKFYNDRGGIGDGG